MGFEVIGPIHGVETIVAGRKIRELARLQRVYGRGRWRKRKSVARVRLGDALVVIGEVRWYEATGIGRREMKLKRILSA